MGQKSRSGACESNVWACEHVEKVLRHVTHAQGVCLGMSVLVWDFGGNAKIRDFLGSKNSEVEIFLG